MFLLSLIDLQGEHHSIKSLVPLGKGQGVQVQAHVADTSFIFVKVGLGFHVQCSLPEALRIASDKELELQAKLDSHTSDICQIKARITLMEEGIQAMQEE